MLILDYLQLYLQLYAALFGAALLGGSAGAWAGMYLFHHKTKHWYFVVGMPLILAIQIVIALVVWRT